MGIGEKSEEELTKYRRWRQLQAAGPIGDFYRYGGQEQLYRGLPIEPDDLVIDGGGYQGDWTDEMLYAQESQRFLSMMSPRSRAMKTAFFPFKVMLAIWFRVAVPIGCHFLDRIDKKRDFTAGYFVRAIKR